ncbi:MAG TPA: GNAT family N-acetyltransferase [Candidatus Limnocylindrales bacterium]|nr:GNAT family N-acetyltransferase [Candidatus Limnocylindrales bacterium]
MSGIVVRAARPDEYEAIGELTLEAYHDVGETDQDYDDELRDTAARARDVPVLVAVDDASGTLLGSVTYVPGPGPWHEGEFGERASFRMLAVALGARGRGAGRRLVEACIARARADGRPGIGIYTRPFMTTAHRLYETFGFRRESRLDWEFAPGEWLWAYELDL